MQIQDIGTISPSGRKTTAYFSPNGTAYVEVPDDHPNPVFAATRAMMLYLADTEQKAGETILAARKRMADYLRECPPVEVTEAQFALSDPRPVRIYREGEREAN